MKILTLEEFKQCPEGALFSLYTPYALGQLMIKGEDWKAPEKIMVSHVDQGIKHDSVEDAQAMLDDALICGESLEMDFYAERELQIKPEHKFAVWEARDIMSLINRLAPELPETLVKQRDLLARSKAALEAWKARYGIISPLYVPPGGDVDLLKHIEAELQG